MNYDKIRKEKYNFENALLNLSQSASELSNCLMQTNGLKKEDVDSDSMDFKQLSILQDIMISIDTLSHIYFHLYGTSIQTLIDDKLENYSILHKTMKHSLLASQETERQRIAADLHDSVVQNLVYLSQQIEIVQRSIDEDTISSKLELASMKKNIKSIITDIRSTIFNLRPMTFDDIGWDAAFIQLKEMIESNSDCSVLLELDKPVIQEQLYLITIYRIVREACINAMKHAQASEIYIQIKNQDDFIYLMIQDNGIGFSLEDLSSKEKHFGLEVMKERVLLLSGDFHIITEHGNGTKIVVKIPI